MRKHYGFTTAKENPYAKRLETPVMIRLGGSTVACFKSLAEETELLYKNLTSLYLPAFPKFGRRPSMAWLAAKSGMSKREHRQRSRPATRVTRRSVRTRHGSVAQDHVSLVAFRQKEGIEEDRSDPVVGLRKADVVMGDGVHDLEPHGDEAKGAEGRDLVDEEVLGRLLGWQPGRERARRRLVVERRRAPVEMAVRLSGERRPGAQPAPLRCPR